MICYLSDVVGPSFRGHENAGRSLPVEESRGPSGQGQRNQACEHPSRGVERTAGIRYLHFIARGSEHLF